MVQPTRRMTHGVLVAALLVALAGGVAAAFTGQDPSRVTVIGGEESARPGSSDVPSITAPAVDPTTPPAVDVGAGDATPTTTASVPTAGAPSPTPGAGPAGSSGTGGGAGTAAPAAGAPGVRSLVPATPSGPMPADTVTVDAVTDEGPAERVAQGFLHGIQPVTGTGDGALPLDAVARLRPTSWRLRVFSHSSDATADWRSFDWARAAGAEIIVVVSDTWHTENQIQDPLRRGLCARRGVLGMQNSEPPWANWDRYRAWLADFVQDLARNDELPTYWDPFNEAYAGTYNACDDFTVSRQLQVWKATYDVIRSIVPDAKIIGPSTSLWLARPDPSHRSVVDAATFLDFVVEHGLSLAGLSWHEIGGPTGGAVELVTARVQEARQMLEARGLTDTLLMVNEYLGIPRPFPGWIVGYIGAFEYSGVDRANRTCAAEEGDDHCASQTVDGLFDRSGAPKAPYWVHAFYADMEGTKVTSTSADPDLSAFAVRDDEDGALRILVGRHAGCSKLIAVLCPVLPIAAPSPADVSITVRAPWVADGYHVVATRIAAQDGAVGEDDLPVVVDADVATDADGFLTFALPDLADGDAFTVTVRPAA